VGRFEEFEILDNKRKAVATRFLVGDRVVVSPDFFWARDAIGTYFQSPPEVTAPSGPAGED
jgi:hypothetical protein